jgi:hypothetical protein
LLGVLVCAGAGLLISPISWLHHYVWIVPALVWLVVGIDRPAKGVYWAAAAVAVFMVMPPDAPGHADALWYVRENAYVISTLIFFALIGTMLWFRNRPGPSDALVQPDDLTGRSAALCATRGEPGRG